MLYTQRGYLVALALVFGSILFTFVVVFLGFVAIENRAETLKTNKARALDIAEAGLDYYRWYLSHFPNDLTNGTTTPAPYIHTYEDPEDGPIGEFALDIKGNMVCGDVTSIDIHSTGTLFAAPGVARTVYGRYARPTVSEFAYIINSNVWAGADRVIIGPYHSNGGIRMDGTNNSIVTSGLTSWSCTSSFGCSPTSVEDGVFGAGPNSSLWSFPSPPINFVGLSVDLTDMKTKAQSSGRYVAPSGAFGYHVIVRNNNTYDLYRVTNTSSVWGYNTTSGWQTERHVISAETFVANYSIPSSCSLVFIEDKVWLEGVVNTKMTVVAADIINAGVSPSMILADSITYGTSSSAGLLAVAEQDMLVGLDTPNDMTLKGIFIAQNGRFGRNHYCTGECDGSHAGSEGLPAALDPYVLRNTLTVHGTIVSNGREGTKWVSGASVLSGYQTRTNSYDRALVDNPPPLTPHTSATYKFIEWQEVN